MFKWLICFLLLISSTISYALTIKPTKDNYTVSAFIANNALNRIYISGDKIIGVHGLDGKYEFKSDDKQGDMFIMPSVSTATEPFDIYINSELGHQYTLHLIPRSIKAVTIAIKPLTAAKEAAEKLEKSMPHDTMLVQLIRGMYMNQAPDGYALIELGKKQKIYKKLGFSFQLVSIYRGEKFQGEVWCVKNDAKVIQTLSPGTLQQPSIKAIAIDKNRLLPNETTTLYWVKQND